MPYGDAIIDNLLAAAPYAVVGAALLGSVMGVFIEKWLIAVLAPIPLIVLPMGALLYLRPFVERSPILTGGVRDLLLALADPSTVLQMAIAASGGALLGWVLVYATRASAEPRRPSANRGRVSAKKRIAAVAERTPLQTRTERVVAAPRPVAPEPIYEVAPVLAGSITASSVAEKGLSGAEQVNRRQRGRRRAILSGFLLLDDNRSSPCRIVDLSDTGARVRLASVMVLPPRLWLINASEWLAYEAALAWRSDTDAGLKFLSTRDLRTPSTAHDKALHALCAHLIAR